MVSNTICWDKKACITINDAFCGRLLARTGSKSADELAEKQAVCKTLASEFDEVYKSEAGLGPEVLKAQRENFSAIMKGQLSRKFVPESVKDLVSRHTSRDAPRPGASLAGQMQIAEALRACEHYASTRQFRMSETGESAVSPRSERKAQ